MRFHLGTSAADSHVPIALGTDVVTLAEAAISDLVALLRARYEGTATPGSAASGPGMRERSYGLRGFRDLSVERRIAWSLLESDSLVDASLLDSYLQRGGTGGLLFTLLRNVFHKSLVVELQQGGSEPIAWVTHLALVGELKRQKDLLKAVTIKGISYEALERTVGLVLSALVGASLEEALIDLRRRGVPGSMARTENLLVAAGTPLVLITIQQSALRPSPNPWGLFRELADALDSLGVDPLEPGVDSGDLAQRVMSRIGKDKNVRAAVHDLGALRELKSLVNRYLADYDFGREPRHEALREAVIGQHMLSESMAQVKTYEAGWHGAASLAERAGGAQLERLEELAKAFGDAARRKGPRDTDAAVRETAVAWLGWRRDRWAAERVELARTTLADRAREFSVPELKSQYDAGRVYRIAPDERPILVEVARKLEEGHLFLDLKGFTRMVAVAKEASAVEFMRREFYLPILAKAKVYRDLGRRLELNNLLGDAVSFSGEVVSLVSLAEDINQIFIDYEERLRQRGVKATRIEAGLFIAFGAPAETVSVDSEGWGDAGFTETLEVGKTRAQRIKVAIAEKINESARGTSRSGAVLARVNSMLDEDAARRNGEQRELPWSVYIERLLQLTLPADVMDVCARAIDGEAAAAAIAGRAVGEILQRALMADDGSARKMLSGASDLYNVGRALSREAVDAFVQATLTTRIAVEKAIAVSDLPPAFSRFFFPENLIRLVVSWDTGAAPGRPLVFRHCGELEFRGYEGLRSTAVYEIVDASSPIYILLARHFLPGWRPPG